MVVQTGNQKNLISWDLSTGATAYKIQRSLDNVTYAPLVTVSGSPLATSYVDSAVTLGTEYFYIVAASNTSGDSSYTNPQSAVPTPTGEMSLGALRLAAMQRADRVNSNFVTKQEWDSYLNQSMFELYDLIVTIYEDYFMAPPIQFVADGTTFLYPLPNGSNTFLNALNPSQTVTPPPFYKILGVDLARNNATNAYVTINKFNFIDRNRFVYPNTASTIYGVFNLQYRIMGSNLEFIPTPSGGQAIRIWYIPRLQELLQDTDITTLSISGWDEYVIVRAAKYALDKEESDTTKLDQQIQFLKARIEESAANRDAGQPDRISDLRGNNGYGYNGDGWGGPNGRGGFAILPPGIFMYDLGNSNLAKIIHLPNFSLAMIALSIYGAYFFGLKLGYFRSSVSFSGLRRFFFAREFMTSFRNHISSIFQMRTEK